MSPRHLGAWAWAWALSVSLLACNAQVHEHTVEKARVVTPPMTEHLHLIGRVDRRDPAGPRFDWPGTAIAATFEGTGIEVTLREDGDDQFAVAVDGAAQSTLITARGTSTYPLAEKLAPGRHTLVLTKRTEATVGRTQLLGLHVHDGDLVPSEWPIARRIEFVGDSITCGYGNLGTSETCPFSPDTEDQTQAYGALAAKRLHADQVVLAYSGIGILRDYEGKTDEQMPVRYERALANDPTSGWAFTGSPPDAVVINLGSNDFAQGDPGPGYVEAYVAFVKRVRTRYPAAVVLVVIGPDYGRRLEQATKYHRQVVSTLNDAGDPRVYLVTFDPQRKSDGYGCDFHPNLITHQRMAGVLVTALKERLGW